MSRDAGMTISQKENDPPTKNAAANRCIHKMAAFRYRWKSISFGTAPALTGSSHEPFDELVVACHSIIQTFEGQVVLFFTMLLAHTQNKNLHRLPGKFRQEHILDDIRGHNRSFDEDT